MRNRLRDCSWLRYGSYAIVFMLNMGIAHSFAQTPSPISILDFRKIDVDESRPNNPTTIQGVVTYSDPRTLTLHLQDGTSATQIRYLRGQAVPRIGEKIQATGTPFSFNKFVALGQAKLTQLGESPLPETPVRTIRSIREGQHPFELVQVRGTVTRSIHDVDDRRVLEITDGKLSLRVILRILDTVQPLYGAKIVLRGVVHPLNEARDEFNTELRADSVRELTNETPAPLEPFATAKTLTIDQLPENGEILFRVRGRVFGDPKEDRCFVKDETDSLTVENPDSLPPLRSGDEVEAIGFVAQNSKGKILKYARVRVLESGQIPNPSRHHFLHSANEIRALSRESALKKIPVRLRGTITHVGQAYHDFFIQDSTGAVYVTELPEKPKFRPGDFAVVEGVSSPGNFSPEIDQAKVTIYQTGSLPTPEKINPEDIISGRLDAFWVELEGTAQRLTRGEEYNRLRLMSRLGPISVRVHASEQLEEFVDRRVRVTGVYIAKFRKTTQSYGFDILSPSASSILVLDQEKPSRFDSSVRLIGDLMDYDPLYEPGKRTRVAGQVTAVLSQDSFFLQDSTGGVFVQLRQSTKVPERGEFVDVSGYIELNALNLSLTESIWRAGPEYVPIQPTESNARSVMDSKLNRPQDRAQKTVLANQLLRIQGRYVGESGRNDQLSLELQDGPVLFKAVFPAGSSSEHLIDIPLGSLIEVVGVCKLQGDPELGVQGFMIVLRDVTDVRIVEQPPWWTTERAQQFAFATLGLLGLAVIGLAYLRYRLRKQGKQIRERLGRELQLQARYRELVEHATDLIFTLDSRGLITGWNQAGENLMRVPRDQLIGKPLSDYVEKTDNNDLSSLYADHQGTIPLTLRSATGQLIYLDVSTRPVMERGVAVGLEAIARDVTERNRLEQRMREVAKMQAVGRLAGGVAHDFNNLLTVINGNTDLLLRQTEPSTDQRELLTEVKLAGGQAASVTRQLLAFGRQTVIAPKTLNLNQVITDLSRVFKRILGEPIQIEFQPDELLDKVRVDPSSLEQAILNLVINARDAMIGGGTLTIRTKNVAGGWVRLEVSDTGHGMNEDVKARIFEPYFTTKPTGHGTGLGLAMVSGFMEQCGGRISVTSEVGRGTTFQLEFEAVSTESSFGSFPSDVSPVPEPSLGNTILLVEDEPSVQLLEKRILESGKYQVLVASSAEEASEFMNTYQGPLDMLVTDVVMPGRNGRELAEELQTKRPGLKVLFLSGYTPDEVLREGVEADAAQFLQKPFTPSDLLKKVKQILTNTPVTTTPL